MAEAVAVARRVKIRRRAAFAIVERRESNASVWLIGF
jgi:hypothetical protein